MSRYIEADTVFNELTNRYKTAKGEERKAYRKALDIVTAVGEIEVVRCKDCKHSEEFIPPEGLVVCWESGVDREVNRNGFCEKGERKD